eukprot:scaffold74404_cov21-Tisochrysis_lutea.AAC.1
MHLGLCAPTAVLQRAHTPKLLFWSPLRGIQHTCTSANATKQRRSCLSIWRQHHSPSNRRQQHRCSITRLTFVSWEVPRGSEASSEMTGRAGMTGETDVQ